MSDFDMNPDTTLDSILRKFGNDERVIQFERSFIRASEVELRYKVTDLLHMLPLLNITLRKFHQMHFVKIEQRISNRLNAQQREIFNIHFLKVVAHAVLGPFIIENSRTINMRHESFNQLYSSFSINPIATMNILKRSHTLAIDQIEIVVENLPTCEDLSHLKRNGCMAKDSAMFIYKHRTSPTLKEFLLQMTKRRRKLAQLEQEFSDFIMPATTASATDKTAAKFGSTRTRIQRLHNANYHG